MKYLTALYKAKVAELKFREMLALLLVQTRLFEGQLSAEKLQQKILKSYILSCVLLPVPSKCMYSIFEYFIYQRTAGRVSPFISKTTSHCLISIMILK